MKTKTAAITVAVCAAMTAGLLAAPQMVLETVPTATVVEVERVEHVDTVQLSGTIVRNAVKNEAYVQTYVPEEDISKVVLGQTAEITGEAFPDKVYTGSVDRIADAAAAVPFGNVKKTAVEVKIGIDDPDSVLKHGYTASVKLITSEPDIMTLVPYEAVDQDETGEFVYILRDGRAEKLYIDTGEELPDGVELKTVIPEGGRIVTLDKLPEGGGAVKLSEQEGTHD